MKNGFKVIDGDGHMQEPMDIWENYTEPAFKERVPKVSRGTSTLLSKSTVCCPSRYLFFAELAITTSLDC